MVRFSKFNKGQAAAEYLMTYSWAILVVFIIGVVLWQIGIFNPSSSPTGAAVGFGTVRPLDWSCKTSGASAGEVQVEWLNSAGEKIRVTPASSGCVYKGTLYQVAFNASQNEKFICSYPNLPGCAGLGPGERFESEVTLTWQPAVGGILHTESGKVSKAAE